MKLISSEKYYTITKSETHLAIDATNKAAMKINMNC